MKAYVISTTIAAVVIGVLVGLFVAGMHTAVAPAHDSGIHGTVVLAPACPVERVPPDPACAPQPYMTTITASPAGSGHTLATATSDASGAFSLSLPPGAYTLQAAGGTLFPRCASVSVVVPSAAYATTTISCDTGIR